MFTGRPTEPLVTAVDSNGLEILQSWGSLDAGQTTISKPRAQLSFDRLPKLEKLSRGGRESFATAYTARSPGGQR